MSIPVEQKTEYKKRVTVRVEKPFWQEYISY